MREDPVKRCNVSHRNWSSHSKHFAGQFTMVEGNGKGTGSSLEEQPTVEPTNEANIYETTNEIFASCTIPTSTGASSISIVQSTTSSVSPSTTTSPSL